MCVLNEQAILVTLRLQSLICPLAVTFFFILLALETFKGRKKTAGSFIPGKGIRNHESIV